MKPHGIAYMQALWATLGAMAPYLLFGFAVAGVISVFLSPARVERALGGNRFWTVVKSAFLGVPLPLCSCGVLPVAASLRRHGAGRGAVMAFLLSTPQTGVDSIMVTYSLLGPVMAAFRPIAAFVTGIIGGALANLQADPRLPESPSASDDATGCSECETSAENATLTTVSTWRTALHHAFVQLPSDIGGSMLVGIILAAGIVTFMPDDWLGAIAGDGPLTMLLMMLIGIPLYVCATASVPIAAALIMKGISPGAALVFLIAGPATNAATVSVLLRLFGKGAVAIYLGTVGVTALMFGLLLNLLISELPVAPLAHGHDMAHTTLQTISAVVLLILLAWPIFKRYLNRVHKHA